MKKLSKTEYKLKKRVANKKSMYFLKKEISSSRKCLEAG